MTPPTLLAEFSDDQLMAAYGATLDDHWHRVIESELGRREDGQRAAAPAAAGPAPVPQRDAPERAASMRQDCRQAERAEWRDAAHAQYLAAEAECRGNLLNRRGLAANVDPWSLWSGPAHRAELYASEELRNFWDRQRRITVTEYQRQASAGRAEERETHRHDQTMGQDAAGQVQRAAARSADGNGTVNRYRDGSDQVSRSARDSGLARAPRGDRAGSAAAMTGMTAAEQVTRLNSMAAAIRARSASTDVATNPGSALAVREPDIDGAQLLRDVRKFLRHFALWPSEDALNVATLAVAAMHAKDPATGDPAWEYAFKLLYTAAEYGAGKSWFAKLTAQLAPRGKALLEPTKPSLIDMIADQNTVVVTEIDELFATAGRNRGIVAVLNACYEPGNYHTRKQGGKVQEVHCYGHQILDGIDSAIRATGHLRAVASRSIMIRVRMAPDGYRRPKWDRVAALTAQQGRDRLAAWIGHEVAAGLADGIPPMPEGLGNPRRCTLYEPLFAVALAADKGEPGYWWTTLAASALQLEHAVGMPDDDAEVAGFLASLADEETELDRQMAGWDEAL